MTKPDLPGAASLSDALGRLYGHPAVVLDLVSPTPGRILFGRAATIRFVPFREDVFDTRVHAFARHFHDAVAGDPTGRVLVLAAGLVDSSVGGGVKLSRLQNHGLAGLVTDGRLRDFEALAAYDPVFYCGGETARVGVGDVMPIAADEPVALGGTTVVPGDYIYADRAGAVVIPASALDETVRLAHEIEAEDIGFLEAIRSEVTGNARTSGSSER